MFFGNVVLELSPYIYWNIKRSWFIILSGWILAPGQKSSASIFDLIKYHLDLRSSPTKSMLKFLSKHASNSTEALQLKRLAVNEKAHELWKWDHPGLIDVLRNFQSIRVDSSSFVYMMKTLQPRYVLLIKGSKCVVLNLGKID